MSSVRILCDFDGTIAVHDVTDRLLDRFADPAWLEIESDWRAGRIDSHECMAAQVAVIDASRAELDDFLDGLEIDPLFAAFAVAARAAGHALEIVSDGIDYAIHRILRRHAVAALPVFANALEPDGDRRWRLRFPHRRTQCDVGSGTCKCARARASDGSDPPVLLIGDGRSDFCVSQRADLVLAKGALARHCRANALPHLEIAGFGDALSILPDLDARLRAARRLSLTQ